MPLCCKALLRAAVFWLVYQHWSTEENQKTQSLQNSCIGRWEVGAKLEFEWIRNSSVLTHHTGTHHVPSPDTFISCAHPPSSLSPRSGLCLWSTEDNRNTCALISAYQTLQSAWVQDSVTLPRVKALLQGRSLRYKSSAKEASLALQSSSFETKASKTTFHVKQYWLLLDNHSVFV